MNKDSYIKLYRALLNNKLWLSEPFTKGQAFIDLLLLANHKKGFIKTRNGEILQINRGECGYSKEALGLRWQWSRGKVSRYIDFLEKNEKMIQQKKYPKYTIIAILNYDKFQNDTINGHQTDTNKKNKEEYCITEYNTHTLYNEKSDFKNRVCVSSLSSEDFEILRFYAKKSGARNEFAYINALIQNGGFREIISKEKGRRDFLKKQQEESQNIQSAPKEPTEQQQELKSIDSKEKALLFLHKYCKIPKYLNLIPHFKALAQKYKINEKDLRC